jgi:hypothetical protein
VAGVCSRGDLPSLVGFALGINPIPALFNWQDEDLHYFVRRDLVGEQVSGIDQNMLWLWQKGEKQKPAIFSLVFTNFHAWIKISFSSFLL